MAHSIDASARAHLTTSGAAGLTSDTRSIGAERGSGKENLLNFVGDLLSVLRNSRALPRLQFYALLPRAQASALVLMRSFSSSAFALRRVVAIPACKIVGRNLCAQGPQLEGETHPRQNIVVKASLELP